MDLDGAFAGEPVNAALVAGVVRAAGDVPVQVGGGIRSLEAADKLLSLGVAQVILGTRAITEPQFLRETAQRFPGRVILGLDARAGRAATAGWDETTAVDAVEFAAGVADLALFAIVFTDIERDGMLSGVNAAATAAVANAAGTPVIASGGVRDLDDIQRLRGLGLKEDALLGVIAGSALYEGTLDLEPAQRLAAGASAA